MRRSNLVPDILLALSLLWAICDPSPLSAIATASCGVISGLNARCARRRAVATTSAMPEQVKSQKTPRQKAARYRAFSPGRRPRRVSYGR